MVVLPKIKVLCLRVPVKAPYGVVYPTLLDVALLPAIVKQRTKEEVGSDTGLPEEEK